MIVLDEQTRTVFEKLIERKNNPTTRSGDWIDEQFDGDLLYRQYSNQLNWASYLGLIQLVAYRPNPKDSWNVRKMRATEITERVLLEDKNNRIAEAHELKHRTDPTGLLLRSLEFLLEFRDVCNEEIDYFDKEAEEALSDEWIEKKRQLDSLITGISTLVRRKD